MITDDILKIVSEHTQGIGKSKTLESLAELENITVDKLKKLFDLTSNIKEKYTVLVTYSDYYSDPFGGGIRTTKRTKIIEVEDLKVIGNKLGNKLIDIKILK